MKSEWEGMKKDYDEWKKDWEETPPYTLENYVNFYKNRNEILVELGMEPLKPKPVAKTVKIKTDDGRQLWPKKKPRRMIQI